MGAKQSSPRARAYSTSPSEAVAANGAEIAIPGPSGSGGGVYGRTRARSLGSAHPSVQNSNSDNPIASPDSDSSTSEGASLNLFVNGRGMPSSLPLQIYYHGHNIKCPICNKMISQEEIDCHLIMCLTKPRINYNEDVLREDKGECVICFEDLQQGDTIARLPCLCIYHKHCIDDWFKRSRSCPGHPND